MKRVFVALANKKFIEYSKSLFHSAKVDGKWDGDFVLIVPEEDRDTFNEKEFTDRGVEIFFGKTLPGKPKPHYYKYYLWTEYFKKWDWIFYCDIDVLFFNEIDFDLDNRQKDILYTNDCNGTKLNIQFEYRDHKVEEFDDYQLEKYNWITENYLNLPSFQSCFMLFHKDLIQDDTFDNLIKLHNEYYVYYDLVLSGLTEEQSILNVEFLGRWKELGDKFLNAYPRADELKWEFDKMGEAFEDDRDYKKDGLMAIHFYQFFQPWSEHNLRFYPIWKEYNDKF
jgi:lipopolysaccharide biosynthesis glycosyltransferase